MSSILEEPHITPTFPDIHERDEIFFGLFGKLDLGVTEEKDIEMIFNGCLDCGSPIEIDDLADGTILLSCQACDFVTNHAPSSFTRDLISIIERELIREGCPKCGSPWENVIDDLYICTGCNYSKHFSLVSNGGDNDG